MNETTRIADQLKRSWEGEAWHGPALAELLKDVDAGVAQKRGIAGAHSIWEIVNHIGACQSEAARALEGQPMPRMSDSEDWPVAPRSEEEWRSAVTGLERISKELASVVTKFPEERLEDQVPGREYNYYFLLHGIAQHNLYHAGQIALLKKSGVAQVAA